MLAYPPISIGSQEEGEVRIIPLKADTVMCEMTGCERPARFLLKYKSGALRAVCEKPASTIVRREGLNTAELEWTSGITPTPRFV